MNKKIEAAYVRGSRISYLTVAIHALGEAMARAPDLRAAPEFKALGELNELRDRLWDEEEEA